MGMIKPCRMELDLVLSSHMTGCDSQAPVEQIKWLWQFAVNRGTVKTVIMSKTLDLSTKAVFNYTMQIWFSLSCRQIATDTDCNEIVV